MKQIVTIGLLAGLIGGAAAARAEEAALPRVMLLMDEKNVGGYSVDQAELALAQHLLDLGYDVVDADLVKARLKRDQALQAMTGSDQAAAALGLEFGADLVIVGRAVAKGSATTIENTSLRSYQATVAAKAIQTDTAALLATAEGTANKTHLDDTAGGSEAIKAAALNAVGTLLKRIDRRTPAPDDTPNKIQVVIADIRQVWQLAAIRRVLAEQIPGTRKVTQRSFISGVATFDVLTQQNAPAFGESLVLAEDKTVRFQVVGITGNKVDAKLIVAE